MDIDGMKSFAYPKDSAAKNAERDQRAVRAVSERIGDNREESRLFLKVAGILNATGQLKKDYR